MELDWISLRPRDEDGGRPYLMWYLVDHISKRCLACIAEPREGNILFVTDIRVSGVDRSFIELEAAKSYCEAIALEDVIRESRELEDRLVEVPPPFGDVPKPGRIKRIWRRVFSLVPE